jgi:hypothetical protein
MKKYYSLILLIATASFAQVEFEKGYFIDNQDIRTECLIRNVDWKDTPGSFDFKLTEESKTETRKDYQVAEFGVDKNKYISVEVDLDQSSDWTERLSTIRTPEYKRVRVFLKLIVDGKYKLYRYNMNEMTRFFFRDSTGSIKPLVYKRFFTDNTRLSIARNNLFRLQLAAAVKCENESSKLETEKLNYTNTDLIKYFQSVNACNGSSIASDVVEARAKGKFHLKASVFLGQHSLGFEHQNFTSHDFGSKTYVSLGAEAEYIVPLLNNKWSAIAEVSYNKFEQDDLENDGDAYAASLRYILISVGGRHYFFLNPKSKIFIDAVLNFELINKDSGISYSSPTYDYPKYIFGGNSFVPGIGVGYAYANASVEFRIDKNGNPTPYSTIGFAYSNLKIIARYQFF